MRLEGKIFSSWLVIVVVAGFIDSGAFALAGDDEDDLQSTALAQLLKKGDGQVPSEFSVLLSKIVAPGDVPYLLVPSGRSIQKTKSDFKDPRVLGEGLVDGASLFLGYAPRLKQAEVISWNRKTGRFDFMIIRGFGGATPPAIEQADRNLCVSCHQGEAPIFPRPAWSEMQVIGKVGDQLRAANQGSNVIDGFDMWKVFPQAPSFYDGAVRFANERLQQERLCRQACGSDKECRTLQLLAALGLLTDSEKAGLQRKLENTWPADGFSHPSSVIPNRDPLLHPESGGTAFQAYVTDPEAVRRADRTPIVQRSTQPDGSVKVTNDLPFGDPDNPYTDAHHIENAINHGQRTPYGIDVTYDEQTTSNGAPVVLSVSEAEEKSAFLLRPYPALDGSPADPKSLRPKVGAIPATDALRNVIGDQWSSTLACLGLQDSDRAVLSRFAPADVRKAVASPAIQSLLGTWPPGANLTMRALLSALGQSDLAEHYGNAGPSEPVDVKVRIGPVPTAADDSPNAGRKGPALFQKYCSRCHSDDTIARLPLDELASLSRYRADSHETVSTMLSSKRMPPPRARVPLPTDEERALMINLLSHDGKDPVQ